MTAPRVSTAMPVRGRELVAPNVGDVRERLRGTLTSEEFDHVWSEVCAQTSIAVDVSFLSDQALDTLIAHIAARGGLCRVLAMSWQIRCASARRLTELGRQGTAS